MKKNPSLIGGACIIASVCVGAGMLGLPSAGAGAWTVWSMLGYRHYYGCYDNIGLDAFGSI